MRMPVSVKVFFHLFSFFSIYFFLLQIVPMPPLSPHPSALFVERLSHRASWVSLFQQALLAVNRPLYPFRETGPERSRSHLISAFALGFLNAISLVFAPFVRAGAKIPTVPVELPPPLDVVNRSPLHTEEVPRLVKEERRARTKGTTTGRMSIQSISDLSVGAANAALHPFWRCDASRLHRPQTRDA